MNKMVHDRSEPLDLVGADANDLVMAPLDALLDAVRSLRSEDWRGHPARMLDHVHRGRLIRLLAQRAGPDDLTAFYEYLRRAAARARRFRDPATDAETDWTSRWRALADLADLRVEVLRTQDPTRVLERAHAREIVR